MSSPSHRFCQCDDPDYPLTVLCAWCGTHLRGPLLGESDLPPSHGICTKCSKELLSRPFKLDDL